MTDAEVYALAAELGVDLDRWPTVPPPESGWVADDPAPAPQPIAGQWLISRQPVRRRR